MSNETDHYSNLSDQLVKHESDRGAVLVGIAVIDENLELLLRATFSQNDAGAKQSVETLFAANGPLNTFWAKCHFACALGLLPRCLFSDLDKMRRLRNRFAHQRTSVDFNDKEVKEIVDSISVANSYRQKLKGKIYKMSQPSPKAFTAELRILESGYIKYSKGCFAICVIEAVAYMEMATSFLKKGGLELARVLSEKCRHGYSVTSRLEHLKKTQLRTKVGTSIV